MHAPERYRELLDAFRDAHREFDVPFSLQVCHWADPPRKTRGEPWNDFLKNCVMVLDKSQGDVMPVGTVSFPAVDPRRLSCAMLTNRLADEQMKRECGDEIMGGVWRTCIVYSKAILPAQEKAVERFTSLAEAAGKELPLSIRETIPHEPNIANPQPRGFVDRWLRLMFWTDPPELQELLVLNQWGDGRELFGQSLSDAADVIERCRLASNAPTFATQGDRWPYWAGQIPQSLLQRHEELTTGNKSPKSQEQAAEAAVDDKSKDRIIAAIANLLEKPKRKPKKVRQAEKSKEEQRRDDAKLGDAWLAGHKSGAYVKYADMPNTGLELWDVKASLDRDRHHRPEVWQANKKPRRKKVVKTR